MAKGYRIDYKLLMPKTPKDEPETDTDDDSRNSGSWGEDQKKREYYYDDAHGYEVYVHDDEEVIKAVDESHD